MKWTSRIILVLNVIALLCSCCSPERTSIAVSEVITASRMDPARVTENIPFLRNLATDAIDPNTATTDSARELLSNLVACALPMNAVIVDSLGRQYLGELGLAPTWFFKRLDFNGQQWVTACVEAKMSGVSVALPISLRGPNTALRASERASFTLEEGAFYGNIFNDPPIEIACMGVEIVPDRVCALEDHPGQTRCGFIFTGNCRDICEFNHGSYRHCGWDTNIITVFGQ